jgi:hypothetical protein
MELGDLPPIPPGIYRFLTCSGKGLIGRAIGGPPDLAVCKAPVGARVASPQSPILRWSKGSVSRFRSLGGL